MIGQTIFHYKILEKLGEGGMGVVYKAQDTKLDRFVALKFLPPHLNALEQDKSRFIQEAKAASSLNHPNVCTIHDIQEQDGQLFIVMEFVDGQTLADKKVSISLKQAIDVGIQIADGLAAAHEKGIVHRDIKPDNIMIRKDGLVQIMDFGLAKLRGASRLTKEGSTAGTAGYMSPEQLQGMNVDHRTDIFSLGVILYELFAGESPFKGTHDAALAYEIVNVDPPPISSLRPELDPEIDRIVFECLQKEPDERFQAAKDISKELKRVKRDSGRPRQSRISAIPNFNRSSQTSDRQKPREGPHVPLYLPWIIAGTCLIAVAVLAVLYILSSTQDKRVIRAYLPSPPNSNFFMYGNEAGPASISPDGKRLAFVAADSSGRRFLYVWSLDATSPRRLAGTEGALHPFWSPDCQFLGYFDDNNLKRIDASGGAPITICSAKNPRGGTWNAEGTIVLSPGPVDPLFTVPAAGGTPTPLTKLDHAAKVNSHRWPSFLPDGKHFLYFARTTASGAEGEGDAICVASLDSKEDKILIHASSNAQYASGFILYTRGTSLVAQQFDEGSLNVKGEAVTVAEGVTYDESTIHSLFTASQNGVLVYQTGSVQLGSQLFIYDRGGKRTGSVGNRAEYLQPRLSADDKRVAVDEYNFQSHNIDLWIYDLERKTRTRFTFAPSYEQYPIWSHDGSRIFFNANPDGIFDLYQKSSGGAGSEDLVLKTPQDKIPVDVSADGNMILYKTFGGPRTQSDLWIVHLDESQEGKDRTPVPFLQTEFNETDGRFSPDDRWIAYTSNESGPNEIYLRAVAASSGRWQVSTSGGSHPRWRRDGKELYYLSPDNTIMAASIDFKGSTVEVSNVHRLFDVPLIVQTIYAGYDVYADGNRFLVNEQLQTQNQTPLSLVVNWDATMKKK
jgi:eukaryotic-like serine/threonine-protein kinase